VSFESFSDFLYMGGHALYVWVSYALGVVVIVANVVAPLRARRRFFTVEAERTRRTRPRGSEESDASDPT